MPQRFRDHDPAEGLRRRARAVEVAATLRKTAARLVATGQRHQRDTEAPEEDTRVGES